MVVYLLTLVLAMFFSRQMQLLRQGERLFEPGNGLCRACFVLACVPLAVVVATRHYVGTDYGNYIDVYLVSSWTPYQELLEQNEPLFAILNRWCFETFQDHTPVFVICGVVTVWMVLYGIYRNSSMPWLSVFLFVTGMYYFDLFNGMRQLIATGIMFAAYPLLKRKKWIPLLLLTIVSYNIHASAYIVLLVFLYAAYMPPRSVAPVFVLGLFASFVVLYSDFAESLVDMLYAADSLYANYEDTLMLTGQGANILRFGLAAVPVVFSICIWPVLRRQREDVGILWNISFFNAMFMMLATRHWLFARFCMFFGIYNVLLWPEILKCFDRKSRQLVLLGVVAVYFLYFWLIVHTDSNLLPYRSWLFGGVYG